MRDKTPKSVPPARISELRALADKIENDRAALDDFLDAYVRLITPAGVPTVAIRQMADARGSCLCHSAMLAIAERVAALELERKQALEEETPEGLPHHA